ncbi:MAG: hemerythrin domain-containing protein [Methanomassiliicoccales archaeon]|nr:hemerythrin domain-containing protein [Methanomassiliicoccales archaeon]
MRVSITLLQYDHGVIRQVLDCLKEILENDFLDEYERVAVDIHDFLSEFMDRFHHRKEENFIFPSVSNKSDETARISDSLIRDHEKAREFLARMKKSISEGSISDRSSFIEAGKNLVRHVTDHIKEEEERAFPIFEGIISVEEDIDIYTECERFVVDEFDADFMRRNEDRAFEIENKVLGPGYYEGIA